MDSINKLLKCTIGAEKWLNEGWQYINDEERATVAARMDDLFKDGLPLDVKHDKLPYIYCFSLLAQIEAMGIQVPLKFESIVSEPIFKQRLRSQLMDELFHGLVFTKIVYMLDNPYSNRPVFNESVERMCNFIRNEQCPKVALIMLNLIVEGWGEELFGSLHKKGIATKVLDIVIEDERRHVQDVELYREMGVPDKHIIQSKLAILEELFITNILFQYQYLASLSVILGANGSLEFLSSLDHKYRQQLKEIDLQPGPKWSSLMHLAGVIAPQQLRYQLTSLDTPMSPMRKVFMTQWDNPSDPTMVGEFNLNISRLDFFNKAYPPEMLTTLILQAISLGLSETPSFRNYLQHGELLTAGNAYTSIAVKLPGCGDQISGIVFENCHLLTVSQLAEKIRQIIKMMVYCYKKREELEKANPHLIDSIDSLVSEMAYGAYPYPLLGNPAVSVSNIGHCGYSRSKSPLFRNESMKFVLLEVERKMVWNKLTREFEAQDILPVSISADHRIFDGNIPVPKILANCFDRVFDKMLQEREQAKKTQEFINATKDKVRSQVLDFGMPHIIDELLKTNLELGYKLLYLYQTLWTDFVSFESLISMTSMREMAYHFQ